MPTKMEPYFGENRFRRELADENDALTELDFVSAPVEDDYSEAYKKGKEGLCWSHYASCPMNIFKILNL